MSSEEPKHATRHKRFRMGPWLVDPQLDEISRIDGVIKLEPRMMRLLARLAEEPGEVVSTEQLLDTVWPGVVVGPASVYQAVSRLRKVLGDSDPNPIYIATVARKGYRLIAPIEQIAESVQRQPSPPANSAPRRSLFRWSAAALLLLILIGVVTTVVLRHDDRSTTILTTANSALLASDETDRVLVVLPFMSASMEARDSAFDGVITLLVRDRLARIHDLVVIANNTAIRISEQQPGAKEMGARLRARYLLRGSVKRTGNEVRLDAALIDTLSDMQVWSSSYAGPLTNFSTVREHLARDVATSLRSSFASSPNQSAIDFDLYTLYADGQRLLASGQFADIKEAQALFERVIAANPDFAPGHLGKGQALVEKMRYMYPPVPRPYSDAAKSSFERAVELDASLGEAWFGRALCNAANAAEAEKMFRRALQLAPNDSSGYAHYSEFLELNDRFDEATQVIGFARRLDPLSPGLALNKAALIGWHRNDTRAFEQLAREALAIDPNYYPALVRLASVSHANGNFAEGIKLAERSMVIRHPSHPILPALHAMYLDVGDADAALAAEEALHLKKDIIPSVHLAQYRRDIEGAASTARSCDPGQCEFWWLGDPYSSLAEAVRDHALMSGDYSAALAVFQSIYSTKTSKMSEFDRRSFGIVYAHTLLLAGRSKEGRDLAMFFLKLIDQEDTRGPVEGWLARDRAAIYAMMGDDAGALAELEASQKLNDFTRWWYTGELDPIFKRLHGNPRFEALVVSARRHSEEQRALVDAMRTRGEIPLRAAGVRPPG